MKPSSIRADAERVEEPAGTVTAVLARRWRAASGATVAVAAVGLVWVAFWIWAIRPEEGAPRGTGAFSLGLPLVLCAVVAALAQTVGQLEREVAELRGERDRVRRRLQGEMTRRTVARSGESAAADEPPPAPRQPALPLPGPVHLSLADLIRALHFPESAEDRAGLAAMARALKDHRAGLVVRAAQDMLELLAQDGIYADDLPAPTLTVADWRAFAAAGDDRPRLPGEEPAGALARCRDRLGRDVVFRDTAHHFLRRFDHMLGELVHDISDEAVEALAATRSARAFLLVGRASGSLDSR